MTKSVIEAIKEKVTDSRAFQAKIVVDDADDPGKHPKRKPYFELEGMQGKLDDVLDKIQGKLFVLFNTSRLPCHIEVHRGIVQAQIAHVRLARQVNQFRAHQPVVARVEVWPKR